MRRLVPQFIAHPIIVAGIVVPTLLLRLTVIACNGGHSSTWSERDGQNIRMRWKCHQKEGGRKGWLWQHNMQVKREGRETDDEESRMAYQQSRRPTPTQTRRG
jgi:hypothetical protein